MAAILKAKSIARSGDGTDTYLRSLLSGEMGIADFFAVQSFLGNAYYIGSADVTSPTTWTATATIDITKPVLFINVPTGKVLIPAHIELYMEAFGTTAQFECQAVSGTGGSYASGMTAIVPVNMRTDLANNSGLSCYAGGNTAVTVGQTANLNIFWRDGEQFAVTQGAALVNQSNDNRHKYVWDAAVNNSIVLCGPNAQLQVNQGSQAGTGFIKLIGVVLDSANLP